MKETNCFFIFRLLATIAIMVSVTSCVVHHQVYHVIPDQQPTTRGVVYCLPKTQLTLTFSVTLAEEKAGPFFNNRSDNSSIADILKKLINLGIINENQKKCLLKLKGKYKANSIKIGEVEFESAPIWNKDLLFLVQWPENGTEARTLSMDLNKAGFLTFSSSKARDQKLDVAVKATKTAASIAGKVIGLRDARRNTAERVIDRIKEIREARGALISPEKVSDAHLDKESLEYRLELLTKEEKSLVRYFVTKKTEEWKAVYYFVPSCTGARKNGQKKVLIPPHLLVDFGDPS